MTRPKHLTVTWLAGLAFLLAGCAADTGARRSLALRSALENASAEVTLEQVRAAAATLPQRDLEPDSPACELCVEAVACEGETCGLWMRRLYEPIVLLAQKEGGATTLRVKYGSNLFGGEALLELWRVLDPEVAEAAEEAAEQGTGGGAAFRSRLGPLVQFTANLGAGWHNGYAVRLGVYHWHTPFFLTAYHVEIGPQTRGRNGRPVGSMDLAFPVRAEFSRWNVRSDLNHGAPEAALYLHAAPVLAFGDRTRVGWRAGVGIASGSLDGALPGTLLVEGYATSVDGDPEPVFGVLVGAGY